MLDQPGPPAPGLSPSRTPNVFSFECDSGGALRRIPMIVRFKLDRVQVKLSIKQWSRFSHDERRSLAMESCSTPEEISSWRDLLTMLVLTRTGEEVSPLSSTPSPLWTSDIVPDQIAQYALQQSLAAPTATQWRELSDLQRYTLVMLTRDGHENANFLAAMREFGPGAGPVSNPAGPCVHG